MKLLLKPDCELTKKPVRNKIEGFLIKKRPSKNGISLVQEVINKK